MSKMFWMSLKEDRLGIKRHGLCFLELGLSFKLENEAIVGKVLAVVFIIIIIIRLKKGGAATVSNFVIQNLVSPDYLCV